MATFRIKLSLNTEIAYQAEFEMIVDRIVSFPLRMDVEIKNPFFAKS